MTLNKLFARLLAPLFALAIVAALLPASAAHASQQACAVGTSANDGTGDPLRTCTIKLNGNDAELYGMEHPGYVVGYWYLPFSATSTNGTNPGSTTIKLTPFIPRRTITIDQLAARVVTASAGGNFQLALYVSDATTHRPTGTPVATVSAAGSTTSAGVVPLTLTANYQVQAGVAYWVGLEVDNATVAFTAPLNTGTFVGMNYGSTITTNLLNSALLTNISAPATYGTWPDLTSATLTEQAGGNCAMVIFHVLSVP